MHLRPYLLLLREQGQGCDYLVGCGMKFEEIEFPNHIGEAIKKAILYVRDRYEGVDFTEITLVPSMQAIDLLDEMERLDAQNAEKVAKEAAELEEIDKEERKEYERLRKKYEDTRE